MELRSGRRVRSSQQQQREDRISALPDDLLLLILAGLRCAAAAARTGVLACRWRGLWTRQPALVFRDVPFRSLEAALGRVDSPNVSLLEIRVPVVRKPVPEGHWPWADSTGLGSLLRAAAGLAPEEFVLALPWGSIASSIDADLPSFHRATSITLGALFFFIGVPAGVEFPALERLTLLHCIVDLLALLPRCPRLDFLRIRVSCSWSRDKQLTVHSASLQELVVDTESTLSPICHVDIVAPSLKLLNMCLTVDWEVSISLLAPLLEEVSWSSRYMEGFTVFGVWRLRHLRLQATKRQGQLSSLLIQACCSAVPLFFQRPRVFDDEADKFRQEIENHMVVPFSVLELHLNTSGHAFGALVFRLLGMDRIRCATQRLKIVLEKSTVVERCPPDCPCEPTNWRSQTISLTALDEVEIHGFHGDQHEIDFLKLIFKCAPMLKRITVKLSQEVSASNVGCTEIYNISRAYSSVEFSVLP